MPISSAERRDALRRLVLLVVAAIGCNSIIGGLGSADAGASWASVQSWVLGSLFLLVPLEMGERIGTAQDPVESYLACSLVWWAALAALGWSPFLRGTSLPAWTFLCFIFPCVLSIARLSFLLIWTPEGIFGPRPKAAWALGAGAVALYSCGGNWGSGYTSPSIMAWRGLGLVHRDTYILSAVTTFIRDYGKVSVGVNGLEEIHYHFFSACIFSGVSKLTGMPALRVYALFYAAVIPPLFIASMTMLCWKLRPRSLRLPPWTAPAVLATMGTYLLPQFLLDWFLAWHPHTSESYGTALILLAHGFYFLPLVSPDAADGDRHSWVKSSYQAIWLFCISLSKISVGFTSWICSMLLTGVERRREVLPKLALLTAGFALVTRVGVKQTNLGTQAFDFLYFIRKNSYGGWKGFPAFILVHWLPVWIGIGIHAIRSRFGMARFFERVKGDRYFSFVVVPACVVGFASFSLTLFAATSYSFSNLPSNLALPWIAALFFQSADESAGGGDRGPREVRRFFGVLLAVGILFQWLPDIRNVYARVLMGRANRSAPARAREELADIVRIKDRLADNPKCALHVVPERLFGSGLYQDLFCWEVPYYYIGILERPLYGSWMRQTCRESLAGRTYNHPLGPDPGPGTRTREGLCARAGEDGFTCVERLSTAGLERIECGLRPPSMR